MKSYIYYILKGIFFNLLILLIHCSNRNQIAENARSGGTEDTHTITTNKSDTTKSYILDIIIPQGKLKIGETSKVILKVTPGKGFHINKEYPTKFIVSSIGEGGEIIGDKILGKTNITKLEDNLLEFEIPLKILKTGRVDFLGEFRFSICNPSSCLLPKEEINFSLEAE